MTTDSSTEPIHVAIVDDHPVVREGTAAVLGSVPGLHVVGQGGDIEDARRLALSGTVDVLVLDLRLGGESGLRLLAEVKGSGGAAIVILTSFDYPQFVEAALRNGAAGYVLKTAPLAELIEAIRRAAAGGLAFSIRPGRGAALRPTARELDVIRLVVEGRTNDEIGAALGIGAKTVETHLHRLYERLDVASRTELATRALREGWLELPPPT